MAVSRPLSIRTSVNSDSKRTWLPSASRCLRIRRQMVGSLSLQSWARMPRSLDERRRAAITHFNAEAVRVMIKRERGLVLREVFVDVPSLIYAEQQD